MALPLEEAYHVTGGTDDLYLTEDGTPLSIHPVVRIKALPQDYLKRPAGTINLIYCVPGFNLGGHGVDSFLIDEELSFRPAKGIWPITVPTYWPEGHPQAGRKTDRPMTFVYGAIEAPGTHRVYGWLAADALGDRRDAARQRTVRGDGSDGRTSSPCDAVCKEKE